jgi:hypothetical protein
MLFAAVIGCKKNRLMVQAVSIRVISSLSSSGASPDFRPNQIAPVAKDYDLNKRNNDDRNNTDG